MPAPQTLFKWVPAGNRKVELAARLGGNELLALPAERERRSPRMPRRPHPVWHPTGDPSITTTARLRLRRRILHRRDALADRHADLEVIERRVARRVFHPQRHDID